MRISELAQRAGVTTKAVRYYETLGLVRPRRLPNGYRDYDDGHLRAVREIRELAAVGVSAKNAGPFIACLALGHEHGDDCASSLAAYRDGIREIDEIIDSLGARRAQLVQRLEESAARTFTAAPHLTTLPAGLPAPVNDGAAAHLPGLRLPALRLSATDGATVDLASLGPGRSVLYLYPLTGRPGVDLPDGWDAIPGARGCTSEACDFRDHHDDLREAGAARVYGLSSQDTAYQAEVVSRLRLPFAMLSDEDLLLADALRLPTFSAPGTPRLFARLTLIVRDGRIEHVFYPIFPPDTHAQQVLDWLRANPV